MAITRELDPAAIADIEKFDRMLAKYLAGELEDDVFRVFRLNNGIYGQRQGGHNQMVRVKLPYGAVEPEQLEMLGHIADEYSRGWGHITTRQNIQLHFVELERIPAVMRDLASVGLTTREACGDTVRNIQGCHLAGACPFEVLDITPWAEAAFQHFLRHPYAQRLPRKFKINFSGCATDCGQAMFNDVGVIAVNRPREDGTLEAGFRIFVAGGLGANPHPALALEEFTAREELLPTLEAVLRTFDHYGNRDNKLRARLKWLVDTMGWDELRERIFKERKFLLAATTWRGGIPELVEREGDAPAGVSTGVDPTPMGWDAGIQVTINGINPFSRWQQANVVRGVAKGTVSAYAYCRLGDITSDQFRALASIQREFNAEVRVTNRQNLVFRGLDRGAAAQCSSTGWPPSTWPSRAPSWSATSWPARVPTPATWPSPRAGAWPMRSVAPSTRPDWPRSAAFASTSRAARTAAASTTPPTSASSASSAGPMAVRHRATRCCSVAASARPRSSSARRPRGCRPSGSPRPPCRWSGASRPSAPRARRSAGGWIGPAASQTLSADLKKLDEFPTPEEAPDFYVDYGETGPYVAETGESECRDLSLVAGVTVWLTGLPSVGQVDDRPRPREEAARRRPPG